MLEKLVRQDVQKLDAQARERLDAQTQQTHRGEQGRQ